MLLRRRDDVWSGYRAPGKVQLEAVDELDGKHGRIMPWRGPFEKCCACGARAAPNGSHAYTAFGGTVDGLPCRFVISQEPTPWWNLWRLRDEVLCGDPRPHFHAQCGVCDVRFKMAPVPP